MTRKTGRRHLRAHAVGIALLFVLAACGGSNETEQARAIRIEPSEAATTDPSESSDTPAIAPIRTAVTAPSTDGADSETAAATRERPTPAVGEDPAAATTPPPVPTATEAPEPTATPMPAAVPTATATAVPAPPAPTPTPTTEPTPTATPTAVIPETVKFAAPDGDNETQPQVIAVDGDEIVVTGEVSLREDESDHYLFSTQETSTVLEYIVTVTCLEVERFNDGGLVAEFDGQQAAVCDAPLQSIGGQGDADDGTVRVDIVIFPEVDDVYVRYEIVVSPVRFVYDIAPEDGDSGSNPVVLDPQVDTPEGLVSNPEGDNEDWFIFTLEPADLGEDKPETAAFPVGPSCSNVRFLDDSTWLVATLFDESGATLSQTACNQDTPNQDEVVKFSAGSTYFVRITIEGTGSASWTWSAN